MNRVALLKKIAKAAKANDSKWLLDRNGANHDVYTLDGVMIPIARHTEFGNLAAETIWKECEVVLGEGWWRA